MRKVLALILTTVVMIQASSVMSAEPVTLGSISGRAIDAAGRGMAGQRVDLMRGGQALAVAVTDMRGSWSFPNLNAGEYVVRTSVNGTVAGARVTVANGQVVAGTMIVVPTSAVSPQFGALASVLANVAAGSVAAVTSVTNAVVNTTEAVSLDAATVAEILSALPPADRQAFAQAVVEAIQENAQGTNQQGAAQATSNIFVDVETTTTNSNGQTVTTTTQTNNFLQVIQQIAVTPPSQAPPTIVITAS